MKITIGSRGSKLALWQAEWLQKKLSPAGHQVEIKVIKTTGDKLADVQFSTAGTKGVFIREIEEALADGKIDLAVHSLKDLPTEQPAGLHIIATPQREDPRDAFITSQGRRWEELPSGSRVGTGSLRRQTQLRALRADLELVPIRGNVDTRLKKLDRGDYDALVLATAGLNRLGLAQRVIEYFSIDQVCPAVGQGALAIEIRIDNEKIERAVKPLDHDPTHQAVRAERALLRCLGGGCAVPIAAHAHGERDSLRLLGVVASLDGAKILRARASGSANEPENLGASVAQDLLRQGARSLLHEYDR